MQSIRDIKNRIKSLKNTAQITKAMEVVSATKMRKSQAFAIQARPYAVASLEMLKNLLLRTSSLPPLLKKREIKKSALLVITSDKGLAGAFNANILKKAAAWLENKKQLGKDYVLITIGKKANDYFLNKKISLHKNFSGFGDFSTIKQTLPVADEIIQGFLDKKWDEVNIVYTNFKTTLVQEAILRKVLPVSLEGIEEIVKGILPEKGKFSEEAGGSKTDGEKIKTDYSYEYAFEPSPSKILNKLIPQLLRIKVHHAILESNASEHSARMVAMKNASDSAKELIDTLNLSYNKARQSEITREITEIIAGKEALEKSH